MGAHRGIFQPAPAYLIGTLGGDLKALVGRTIEVRGWIDRRGGAMAGPEIDVSTAGMIRVADAP